MIWKFVFVALATAIVLPAAAFAELSGDAQKCLDKYNNFGRLVGQTALKEARKCVKDATKGKQANPDGCIVNNPSGKIAGKEAKVTALYPGTCTGAEPIQQGAATSNAAMRGLGTDLSHDLFGDPVNPAISTVKLEGKCQDKVILRAGQLATEKLKAFRSCKKDGMKLGTITDSASLEAECLPLSGIPDPKGKIAKRVGKLSTDTDKNCAAVTRPPLFPGACSVVATTIGDFVDCVEAATECRVCKALNASDGTATDCDLFDDGVANNSCPYPIFGIGTHKCTFGGASSVSISTQGLPLPPNAATGAIDIIVGTTAPDGKAEAECELQFFDPMPLLSIGFVCFTSGAPCPVGEIDCNGGNALDVDMLSDHNIGVCTGNADCATQCTAHCAPDSVFNFGCEGFCIGGQNDGLPCVDAGNCPSGSCPGRVVAHGNICGCDCLGVGGAPSAAGGLQCNLSVNINVESAAPCGDGDVLIGVGTRCLPLTTETITSQIVDANNTPGKLFPPSGFTNTGARADCPALATSTTTGIKLVGAVNFFDSALGDLTTTELLICQ